MLFWGGYLTKRFVHSPNMIEKDISQLLMHLIVIFSGTYASYLTGPQD
jgi:hypothetical protein